MRMFRKRSSGAEREEQRHSGESGFTLLEMLVAIAILGGSMAAIFASFAWASEVVQRAALSQQARVIAQSMLALASVSARGMSDSQGDTDTGLIWQMRVIPEASAGPEHRSRAATVIINLSQSEGRTRKSYSLAGLVLTPVEKQP